MGLIFGLLLVVLGVLATQDFLGQKAPSFKSTLEKLNVYAEYFGLAGLLCGFIWLLNALRYVGPDPILALEILAASLIALALGLIFGLPVLHKIIGEPAPGFLLKADKWSVDLKPYQKQLGFAAIALGILSIL